ncbi:MAG: hypothetical protein K2Y40_08810 [Reyranella sp.]|nr:hypothetical protein [Reyranella sp.]
MLSETLRVAPVALAEWSVLLLVALVLLVVMEIEKWWDQRKDGRAARRAP